MVFSKTFVYAYTGPQLSRPNSSKDVRVANIAVRCNITSLVFSRRPRRETNETSMTRCRYSSAVTGRLVDFETRSYANSSLDFRTENRWFLWRCAFTMSTGLSKISVSLETRTIAIRSLKSLRVKVYHLCSDSLSPNKNFYGNAIKTRTEENDQLASAR